MLKTLCAALIGLAVTTAVSPANAFVAQVATSIAVPAVENEAQFQDAVYLAIKDVVNQAIAFKPSLVQLQGAKLVGDRLYLLLLVADPDGEETLKTFEAAEAAAAN